MKIESLSNLTFKKEPQYLRPALTQLVEGSQTSHVVSYTPDIFPAHWFHSHFRQDFIRQTVNVRLDQLSFLAVCPNSADILH